MEKTKMIRDITIGQYYPAKSIVHRLDPRVKLVSTLLYLISLFLFKSISGYLIATLFLIGVIGVSRVPFSFIVRGLKPVIMLLMITVLFNLFLTRSGEVLFHAWIFTITEGGLVTAVYMAVRLIYLIIGSSLMTFTTTPNELTDGIEALLYPLNKVRVPVHEVAMMMSIALRFIPILLEETDKIMKAQIARGADFESGNMIQRAKSMIPILVPLFVSAFRRANDLAMAMEARCYRGGEGRTKMKPLRYRSRDFLAYLTMAVYVVLVVVIGRNVPLHVWIF
jgi:energy-coupling factor transport system permease protein